MDASELLQWIIKGGAVAIVAWAVSWLPEDFEKWHKLPSKVKWLIQAAAAFLIGSLAIYLQALPPETLAKADPYIQLLVAVSGAYLANQVAYKVGKKL